MIVTKKINFADREIVLEFGKFARQANGSVMVSCGGTQVLVTVCADSKPLEDADFVPLGVDYIEKSYAIGRVPGGYLKREGKPSDLASLNARVLDRPIRPCLPKNYRHETVITSTVMSYEHGVSPIPLALLGASTALMISDVPFNGPVAGVRLGLANGQFIVDPKEGESSELDLTIACTEDAVLMVEAGAQLISEDQMLDAIEHAHQLMKPLFEVQNEIRAEIGKPKFELTTTDSQTLTDAKAAVAEHSGRIADALKIPAKVERNAAFKDIKNSVLEQHRDNIPAKELGAALDAEKSKRMRQMVLDTQTRIDGRRPDEIRPLSCEPGILHKAHGSALFTRGETQSLSAITLAAEEDQQRVDTLWNADLKGRFMLHYNFPPFCVGEARMQRQPGRREIGHGNLAQKAILPILPDIRDFGYTMRVVSETLESNGSSSMASVCSGTMALLNAGVPLKKMVAGIAMGLIKDEDKTVVLSDITGDEDHLGDMDFKVCGTEDGITALQMDIKIAGISRTILKEALAQAKAGRNHILSKMKEAISEPSELADTAPRIFRVKIKTDQIKDLVGPGGKTIKRMVSETGAKIDIGEDGVISIVAPDALSAQAAKAMIRGATVAPQVGEVYLGKVVRIVDFGMFVELKPGVEGLCHISQLDTQKVDRVDSVAQEGEQLLVKIIDIDKQGRVKLSRKDALKDQAAQQKAKDKDVEVSAATIAADSGADASSKSHAQS